MSVRCTCPGLNISPDCPRHNYDPSEDEPGAAGGWLYDPDLEEARIHQTLGPDELEG